MDHSNNLEYSNVVKNADESITALILAGGLGTRLRSVIGECPKVLSPIHGRPFIFYILDKLNEAGLSQVILSVGYLGNQVRDVLGDEYKGLTIKYSKESNPLGTGGAVRLGLPLITNDSVLVMNGDSYVDANLASYLTWYVQNGHQSSLLLAKVPDTGRYGRLEVDEDGHITFFEEKGTKARPSDGWINAGVYIFKKYLLTSVPSGKPFSLEREFLPNLVGNMLFGFRYYGAFIDIGTPESYAKAEKFFSEVSNT